MRLVKQFAIISAAVLCLVGSAVAENEKSNVKKQKASKSIVSKQSVSHSFKSGAGSAADAKRLSLGVYAFGNNSVHASEEYAQASYEIIRGISIGGGASITAPSEFYFGVVNMHSENEIIGFSPSFQVGYSGFTAHNDNHATENSGLLLGVSLSYPVNRFSEIDIALKRINNNLELNHGSHGFASVGLKIKM